MWYYPFAPVYINVLRALESGSGLFFILAGAISLSALYL